MLIQGNLDLARSNLEREGEVGEIKNQIAIIRWGQTLASQILSTCPSKSVHDRAGSDAKYLTMHKWMAAVVLRSCNRERGCI